MASYRKRLLHCLRRRWRHLLWLGPLCLCLGILGAEVCVILAARGRVYDDPSRLPPAPTALVLGTAKHLGDHENVFYRARIDAAAVLWKAGKVRGVLLSGDNSRVGYNEPRDMRDDLIDAGVPPEYITLDHAGFRTLDSVIRARDVFGQDRFIVVSQRFHVERALFICRVRGIEANGFVAADPPPAWQRRVRVREVLARCAALLDVTVLRKQPRFLGQPETVALRPR